MSVSSTISFAMICLVIALSAHGAPPDADTPIRIDRYRQLFVDDYLIDQMRGVTRRLHQPDRHPSNPLIVSDRRWEGTDVYIYGTVMRDPATGRYRMWYQSWSPPLINYAISEDGIRWEKPKLGVHPKGDNVIAAAGDLYAVIHTPDDPDPSRRYKRLQYLGPGAYRWGAFFSPDGLRWKGLPGKSHKSGYKPVLKGAECNSVVFDEQSGQYVAFPKMNFFVRNPHQDEPFERRSVTVAFSDDFVNWTELKTILVPDKRDDELATQRLAEARKVISRDDGEEWHRGHFYLMCGFPYEGMYIGLLNVFDASGKAIGPTYEAGGEDGIIQVELVSSRDLVNWHRVADRALFIPRGPDDAFDASSIYTSNRPVVLDDEIRIYYGGIKHSHGAAMYHKPGARRDKAGANTKSGIGLATLRLDGWVSIDAGETPGSLTTKPLSFDGGSLVINADASAGLLAVEVLDAFGRPIPGFTETDCNSFTGDAIRHTVSWRQDTDISRLTGRSIRLRFHLHRAQLYSFSFQP